MAEPRIYKDDELPIPVPPVNRAWDDMLQRLDREQSGSRSGLPHIMLTILFLLSWLVVTEPVPAKRGSGDALVSQDLFQPNALPGTEPKQEDKSPGETILQPPDPSEQTLRGERNAKDHHVSPRATPKRGEQELKAESSADDPELGIIASSPLLKKAGTDTTGPLTESPASSRNKDQDSATAMRDVEKEEKQKEDQGWQLRYGPQWEWQIPSFAAQGYFDGPSNKAAPWRMILPALWLEARQGKNALSVSFNPFHAQVVPEKIFRIQNSLRQTADTTISREERKALYKTLGLSASLGYAREVHPHWWAGLSLQAAWWQQGLASSDVMDTYIVAGQVTQAKPSSYTYKITDEWTYFNKMQTFLYGDLYYSKPRWQAGLKAGVALTPLSKGEGPGHMFRSSLVVRWTFGK